MVFLLRVNGGRHKHRRARQADEVQKNEQIFRSPISIWVGAKCSHYVLVCFDRMELVVYTTNLHLKFQNAESSLTFDLWRLLHNDTVYSEDSFVLISKIRVICGC